VHLARLLQDPSLGLNCDRKILSCLYQVHLAAGLPGETRGYSCMGSVIQKYVYTYEIIYEIYRGVICKNCYVASNLFFYLRRMGIVYITKLAEGEKTLLFDKEEHTKPVRFAPYFANL
jgi:hypothetical protein